jgi:VanZ family protein
VRRSTIKQWLPFILWVTVIFAVSSIPRLSGQKFGMPSWSDKVAHFLEYAILAFLFYRGEGGGRARPGIPAWLVVIAAGIAIGCVDEVHQRFVPGRDASPFDLAADAAGVVTGTLFAVARFRSMGRHAEKP